ncbi:MAG: acyl-CoA synthetase FdrA [Acholeplasmataceae bacterium]|nr:acyl-CoA synthetase FdrA [Acholeplasmataceae bacterium]
MKDYKILKNSYYDSVTLMSTTVTIKKDLELKELVMFMGTEMNKAMIESIGLYHLAMDEALPNDLIIAAELSQGNPDWAEEVLNRLNSRKKDAKETDKVYKTINQAADAIDANIAVISVPGIYAANEAYKALDKNMHVMLFSDNVSVEDEIQLKDIAIKKDLLVMGPDCGTAIINGKGLCFANQVSEGSIGLVAASGTGLQEVTVIIDRFGGGITQAIGVGGRDLSEAVGGRMMLKGIDALDQDEKTEVIVLISKPPHPTVLERILDRLKKIHKPTVLCLLDSHLDEKITNVYFTSTMTEAAMKALSLVGRKTPDLLNVDLKTKEIIEQQQRLFSKTQKKIKGLYCGGTLTAESLSILRPMVENITSNVAKKDKEKMHNPLISDGHNLVDLGDDIFTQGKPHPMIEPTIRFSRMIEEAKNPETAVMLLDFELGIGSHDDPVSITLDTIKESFEIAKKGNRNLSIVAYVCGTDKDHQGLEKSEELLRSAGVIVAKTNAHAAIIAGLLVKEVER